MSPTPAFAIRSSMVLVAAVLGACSEAPETPGMGEQVVNRVCVACHAAGLNGAPIIGNKKMWAKRLPQGVPVLVTHATQGYGLMPAKGGREELTDEQIEQAVAYMVSRVR